MIFYWSRNSNFHTNTSRNNNNNNTSTSSFPASSSSSVVIALDSKFELVVEKTILI